MPALARAVARAATPTRSSAVPGAGALGRPQKPQRVLWLAGAATVALLVVGIAAAMHRPGTREAAPLPPPPVADTRRDSTAVRDLLIQAAEREQSGNLTGARELLEAAIAADPENAEAHYQLAGLLMATEPERARAEYEVSQKIDPVRYGDTVARILDGVGRQ